MSMMRGLRLTESWEMTNELRVRSVEEKCLVNFVECSMRYELYFWPVVYPIREFHIGNS